MAQPVGMHAHPGPHPIAEHRSLDLLPAWGVGKNGAGNQVRPSSLLNTSRVAGDHAYGPRLAVDCAEALGPTHLTTLDARRAVARWTAAAGDHQAAGQRSVRASELLARQAGSA